jgi:hypothetical protein
VDDIRAQIRAGDYDQFLDRIQNAVASRRKRLAEDFADTLKVGDHVVIKGLGMGAKYLNGAPAIVTGFAIKNVKVQIDSEWDTRRYSHTLRIPPNNLARPAGV